MLGIFSLLIILCSTGQGVGIGGDATIYLTSARNLLDGNGLGLMGPRGEFRLLPYFPPFFSLVISFFGLLGIDLEAAAHWLNMLLFSGLVCLAAYATARVTKSLIWGFLTGLLLAVSPVLIPVYSWAMSEPLAFMLGFAGLWVLMVWLRNTGSRGLLLFSGVLMGLAFLTRYSAAAYLAAGWMGLLLFARGGWRKKIADSLLYFISGLLPMLIWVVYDVAQTASVASRSVETAGGMIQRFIGFWPLLNEVFLFWLIPDSWISAPRYTAALNTVLVIGFLVGFAAWFGVLFAKMKRKSKWVELDDLARLTILLGLFTLAYLGVVLAVYVVTYPPITIGARMLAPVHIAVLWLFVLLAAISKQLLAQACLAKMDTAVGYWADHRLVWRTQRAYR